MAIFTQQITSTANDQNVFGGNSLTDDAVTVSSVRYGALRFTAVTVPKDAIIADARLKPYTNTDFGANSVTGLVKGIAGNCPSWSTLPYPAGLTQTSASAALITGNSVTLRDHDITAIVQEIVDGTWASGDAMGFLLTYVSGSGTQAYEDVAYQPSRAAVLEITYVTAPDITSPSTVDNLIETPLAHTVTATNTIASMTITGGADAASFEVNGTNQLRFASNASSTALGSLVVDIEITDIYGLTDTQTITVPIKAIVFKGAKVYSRAGATSSATSSLSDFRHPSTGTTNIPADIGDIIVVIPAIGATADRDMIVTTGYTEHADHYSNGTSYDANIGLFTKAVTTTNFSTTFGSTGSTADAQGAVLMLFRGVDLTTPMDVAVVLGQGTGTGKPDPAAITPVTTGAVAIFGGAQAAATAVALTSSDLDGFRQIIQADTNDIAVGAGFIEWTSGAINPAAFGGGSSNAANSWATVSAVLRPAWTGGGPTRKPYNFGFIL